MRRTARLVIASLACAAAALSACTSVTPAREPSVRPTRMSRAAARSTAAARVASSPSRSSSGAAGPTAAPGAVTMAFAGDVHFAGRVGTRLAHDPADVFGAAAPGLRRADLTMVNLETAITTGGIKQPKEFTFRAPPTAFTALRAAGIDVATMANNHGADYGAPGLRDSLAAIHRSGFPVVGIGSNAAEAYAPYRTTLHGVRVAIIAADQVQDETTLRLFSAGPSTPGVANAYSPQLTDAVRRARDAGYLVVVYVHWGIEYHSCPSSDQIDLAGRLARAGATAVIGTHAHVLQGAGWRRDGTYVAYGLGNYLWWMSFGNNQDDNGVLTLTLRHGAVVADSFSPAHLDASGVPVPAVGAAAQRIDAEWQTDRRCAGLSATPPH